MYGLTVYVCFSYEALGGRSAARDVWALLSAGFQGSTNVIDPAGYPPALSRRDRVASRALYLAVRGLEDARRIAPTEPLKHQPLDAREVAFARGPTCCGVRSSDRRTSTESCPCKCGHPESPQEPSLPGVWTEAAATAASRAAMSAPSQVGLPLRSVQSGVPRAPVTIQDVAWDQGVFRRP